MKTERKTKQLNKIFFFMNLSFSSFIFLLSGWRNNRRSIFFIIANCHPFYNNQQESFSFFFLRHFPHFSHFLSYETSKHKMLDLIRRKGCKKELWIKMYILKNSKSQKGAQKNISHDAIISY